MPGTPGGMISGGPISAPPVGVELSLDATVGYFVPLTFTAGAAWRNDPVTGHRGFAAFGRVGRAF